MGEWSFWETQVGWIFWVMRGDFIKFVKVYKVWYKLVRL